MTDAADAELDRIVDRLRQDSGDEAAWSALYRRMWPYVLATLYRQVGGIGDLAEDLAQEVFVRLLTYQPFARIPNGDHLRRYLGATCTNVARDFLTRLLRGRDVEPSWPGELGAEERDPLRRALAAEQVAQILGRLAEPDRTIVVRLARGESHRQIAEAVGGTPGSIAVRIHRLRRGLAERFAPPGGP